jgi:hypothetical protein
LMRFITPDHLAPSSLVFSYAASRSRRSWTTVGRGAGRTPCFRIDEDVGSALDGRRADAPEREG